MAMMAMGSTTTVGLVMASMVEIEGHIYPPLHLWSQEEEISLTSDLPQGLGGVMVQDTAPLLGEVGVGIIGVGEGEAVVSIMVVVSMLGIVVMTNGGECLVDMIVVKVMEILGVDMATGTEVV